MNDSADDLSTQLRRVRSDLTWRHRVRLSIAVLAVFIIIDLLLSIGLVLALMGVRYVQHEACQRDNRLRASYVAQWEPIVAIPPTEPGPDATEEQRTQFAAQQELREQFRAALIDDFAVHSC